MHARALLLALALAGCAAPAPTASVTLPLARGGGAILTRLDGAGDVALCAAPGVSSIDVVQVGAAPFEVVWAARGETFRARVAAAAGRVTVDTAGVDLALEGASGIELRLGPDGSISLGPRG